MGNNRLIGNLKTDLPILTKSNTMGEAGKISDSCRTSLYKKWSEVKSKPQPQLAKMDRSHLSTIDSGLGNPY